MRHGNNEWKTVDLLPRQLATLSSPVWLVLTSALLFPIAIFETATILNLAVFLLSARSYRSQTICNEVEIKISHSNSSLFKFTTGWILLSISILLAVGAIALFGLSVAFRPTLDPGGTVNFIGRSIYLLFPAFWWIIALALACGVSYLYRTWQIGPFFTRLVANARHLP